VSVRPLTADERARALAVRDLTDPAEGPHAIQRLIDDVVTALRRAWHCDVVVHRGTRVVPIADNYDALGYDTDAITRDARYTRYVDSGHMLRSHTSALVPGALRGVAAAADHCDDVLVVCPGIVYRRDSIDRLHTGTPHQLDLWRVTRRPIDEGELKEMIELVVRTLVPGAEWNVEPRVHPYTTDGLEIDVENGDEWVEVGECGVTGEHVLRGAGLADHSGLAMGLGLDRVLMLRKGIADIRLLRATDRRVSAQMRDLSLYRPVSNHPAIARDLSIAVGDDDDVELIGDRVRDALGDDADAVEAVEVLSETPPAELSAVAIERLGLRSGQKNVLVRVVLRHPARTLTREEANDLRDRVYAAVHCGIGGSGFSVS
jgi:phenylalanyl-tRNA synthetase alpha chain